MAKQRWSDIPPRKRKAIVAIGIVQNALLAAALIDIKRRPARDINGSKGLWAALSFINFVGPVVYYFVGRRD
jgi:Phospholipase_D-nuclease N-terminal